MQIPKLRQWMPMGEQDLHWNLQENGESGARPVFTGRKTSRKKKKNIGCENFVDFHNRKRIYHINILISIMCRKLDRVGIAGHERHSKMLEVYGLTWKTVQTSYIFWVRIQIGSNSATHSTLDDSSSNPNKSSIVPYWNVQGGAPAVRNEL